MEIKVQCRKDEGGTWIIEDPGPVYVTERRLTWTFEGIEPGVVPLLAFVDDSPYGPFLKAWFTASTITAELGDPVQAGVYDYEILLVQWTPKQSSTLKQLGHRLKVVAPLPPLQIKVSWEGPGTDVCVDPEECEVGAAAQVEWLFDIPENVFATIDFGTWTSGGGLTPPRPLGPFAELHGRKEGGFFRVTGQTDLRKASYQYLISLYDRTTGKPFFRHDPKIDNNGVPPGG